MKRHVAVVSLTALAIWLCGFTRPAGSQTASGAGDKPSEADLRLVRGALDIDVHMDPDSVGPHSTQGARGPDVIDVARRAKELGMRGFVIKQHYDQSAGLAYIARKVVPGVEVYGGVIENLTVGGLNPASVYHLAEVKGGWGRVVFFPTWDSENSVRQRAKGGAMGPFVPLMKDTELVQAARDVIAAVAATRTRDSAGELMLETGYTSADEALAIVREAQKQGVKHIVVSHASTTLSVAQMQEAAKIGAFLEFAPPREPAAYAAMIRQVGVDNVIMCSDLGQEGRPLPPDGLAVYAGMMRQQGFTEQELHRMMAENPARALGLPPPASSTAQ